MKSNRLGLTYADLALWLTSITLTVAAFFIFDRSDPLRLIATPIGVTSLILCAKGNPWGQLLMIIFSVIYGIISLSQAYYGEMMTYLGMTAPMALAAFISWLRHPFEGKRAQVKVGRVGGAEWLLAILLTASVTAVFYFILKAFNTASLALSTLSVSTSFIAVYLSFRRSPFFALAYAANDVVLILLWALAAGGDMSYISVLICFVTFLVNDIYGFISWRRMEKDQMSS